LKRPVNYLNRLTLQQRSEKDDPHDDAPEEPETTLSPSETLISPKTNRGDA